MKWQRTTRFQRDYWVCYSAVSGLTVIMYIVMIISASKAAWLELQAFSFVI